MHLTNLAAAAAAAVRFLSLFRQKQANRNNTREST